MTDLVTLKSRLSEAETAYHLLMTGSKEVSVNIGGYGAVTYQNVDAPKLEKYIVQLKIEIKRKQGGFGRKALYVEF
ncbi:gpW family head-tail joining protein [Bartonella queenslandensis]|uniref:gpW family head-tail joining protein n=1 Tax=Bartonella queenslandensis TaxID=481138 RepID=UPI00030AF3D4|nr:gpW family head-tail joining protein [Bartonella queenslandensis]